MKTTRGLFIKLIADEGKTIVLQSELEREQREAADPTIPTGEKFTAYRTTEVCLPLNYPNVGEYIEIEQ